MPFLNLDYKNLDLTADVEARRIKGLAVPLDGRVFNHGGQRFTFLPNSVSAASSRVPLLEYHDSSRPVGLLRSSLWDEAGWHVDFSVSKTPAGDSALQLANDRVLALSVGVSVDTDSLDQDADGVYQITQAACREISLTPLPMLATSIDSVSLSESTEEPEMPDPILTDLAASVATTNEQIEDLKRTVATLSIPRSPAAPGGKYRNFGELLKGAVAGESEAFDVLNLDYTGTTTADVALRPAYVADSIRLVEQLRVSQSLFSSAGLPPNGMTVEYLILGTDSSAFAEQVHQGDELTYSHVTLDHTSAPVRTYGSWTSMSLQTVQRSQVSIVELTFNAMVRQAAKTTDLAFIAILEATAAANPHIIRAGATVDQWSNAFTDAEIALAATGLGLPAEFVLMDLVSFKAVKNLRGASAIPFLVPQGAQSIGSGVASGSINTLGYAGLRGEVSGLPLYVDPNLASGTVYVGNSAALQTYGDSAPVRLNPDMDSGQIKTLTTAFSCYLMQAITTPNPTAVVKITTA